MEFSIQSNLNTTATLGTQKKWQLFRGGRYSEVPLIKLVLNWDACGSGWLLLTGGHCSRWLLTQVGLYTNIGPNDNKKGTLKSLFFYLNLLSICLFQIKKPLTPPRS
jgi:hypothetical protein